MKSTIHITLDINLLDKVKKIAASKNCSISELVECHFTRITHPKKPLKKKNIIDLVEGLPKPKIDLDGNLIAKLYEKKLTKHSPKV